MANELAASRGVSVIVTVRNEAGSIGRLLASLEAQSQTPDEIVVVDAGSTDRTLDILAAYSGKLHIEVLSRPGLNRSQGRNVAVEHARSDVIAATDAGVSLSPNWLEELTRPIASGAADVVSGFFAPDAGTPFEAAMGATVLPALRDVDPRSFLPSSRSVAFTKSAWRRVGGYPEWLDYCEDLVFDLRLRICGCRFAFAPEAIAHFKPRSNLCAFVRQYYLYARGDGKADLWRKRHAIRYATYVAAMWLLGFAGRRRAGVPLGMIALGSALYLRDPYRRLWPLVAQMGVPGKLEAAAWVPVIRLVGDVAKMVGYPVGLIWRLRQSGSLPDWRVPSMSAEGDLVDRPVGASPGPH